MIVPVINRHGDKLGLYYTERKILEAPYYSTCVNDNGEIEILFDTVSYTIDNTTKVLTWEDVNNISDSIYAKDFVRTITTETGILLNGYRFNDYNVYYAYIPKDKANGISIDELAIDALIKTYDTTGFFIKFLKNMSLHVNKYITTTSNIARLMNVGSCETLIFPISAIMYDSDMKQANNIANDHEFRNVKNICVMEHIDENGKVLEARKRVFLNESYSFDFFKDCRTYKEKKEKVIDFLKRGLITASFASMLFSFIAPNKAAQEAFEREVIETITGHDLGSEN